MATRYYLPVSGAAAVSPAFDTWAETTAFSPDRIACVTAKSNTARTSKSVSPAQSNHQKYLARQYVSSPIGIFNFTGTTVSGVVQLAGLTAFSVVLSVSIRLFHPDTTFTTLLALADFDTALSSTASQTRIIASATALAAVTSQNNDRLVIEIGQDLTAGSGTITLAQFFGDPSATADYALTSGLTTTLDPWIEFSGTLPAPSAYNSKGQFFHFF